MTEASTVDLSTIVDPVPVGRRLSLERSIIAADGARVIPEVASACMARAADLSTGFPQ